MLIGLLFAFAAIGCGVAVQRGLGLRMDVAPLSGLALIAVLTSWTTALGLPPLVATGLVVVLALAGVLVLVRDWPRLKKTARVPRSAPLLLVAGATLTAALILGSVFAGVEAPVSTHDGAFHVETIDTLRRGIPLETWYPIGFHASVAAILALVPWLDSAHGTAEVAQGLAVLAPLAVFSLSLALGTDALVASMAAVILALTWTYPYDYFLWGGWPQGMGVLLVMGVLIAALRWIEHPSLGWAALGSLCAGAIVVTHGTDLYSALFGLVVIVLARARQLNLVRLAQHLPLALLVTIVAVGPYLLVVLHWAAGGAAVSAGQTLADSYASASMQPAGRTDWLQFVVNVTGADSYIDLPLRVALIGLGLTVRPLRLAAALWVAFVLLLASVEFIGVPIISTVFALTYPWLDGRPREVVVLFAALLAAGGLSVCVARWREWRRQFANQVNLTRRVAIAGVVLLAFFAEGSAVSVYKRLAVGAADQNVLSADDQAAMAWLRQHAQPGQVVANDQAADAGIWAPYKADVPILLPRSVSGPDRLDREPILAHVLDLNGAPAAEARACALHVDFVYRGAHGTPFEDRTLGDVAALARVPYLERAFSSGDAAVFRVHLPC